jgi:hypothetical protein
MNKEQKIEQMEHVYPRRCNLIFFLDGVGEQSRNVACNHMVKSILEDVTDSFL